jgi:blue light- and temperature-responsive anti-repressor
VSPTPGTLHRLVYLSRNRIAGGAIDAEIAAILATARRNNARHGVTGALLFSAGTFAQVLEGPLAAIERIFERIQCDARHDDVIVLQIAPIKRRAFPDWSMAFAGTAASAATPSGKALARALSGAEANAGTDIVAALRELVQREAEWAV